MRKPVLLGRHDEPKPVDKADCLIRIDAFEHARMDSPHGAGNRPRTGFYVNVGVQRAAFDETNQQLSEGTFEGLVPTLREAVLARHAQITEQDVRRGRGVNRLGGHPKEHAQLLSRLVGPGRTAVAPLHFGDEFGCRIIDSGVKQIAFAREVMECGSQSYSGSPRHLLYRDFTVVADAEQVLGGLDETCSGCDGRLFMRRKRLFGPPIQRGRVDTQVTRHLSGVAVGAERTGNRSPAFFWTVPIRRRHPPIVRTAGRISLRHLGSKDNAS